MISNIVRQLYIPKCEIEGFRGKMEKLIVSLGGSNKVEYSTSLVNYQNEEVIVFNIICNGDTEEERNQELEKFKELIKASFGEEPKEK